MAADPRRVENPDDGPAEMTVPPTSVEEAPPTVADAYATEGTAPGADEEPALGHDENAAQDEQGATH